MGKETQGETVYLELVKGSFDLSEGDEEVLEDRFVGGVGS